MARVVPAAVASRANAAAVAALVTRVGAAEVVPGSVGMTAELLEFATLNSDAGLMVRYICPRGDVQDGMFMALPLIAV